MFPIFIEGLLRDGISGTWGASKRRAGTREEFECWITGDGILFGDFAILGSISVVVGDDALWRCEHYSTSESDKGSHFSRLGSSARPSPG